MGVKSATTYDQYGNSTANVVQPSADAPLMKTETVYSDNGNYVISQKDARGNSVVNLLDSNGRTVSVTDPAGNSVFYAYDASNRVIGVTSEASGKVYKNSYTYENDRIKTIAHNTTSDTVNDVIYTFEYDELGRKTAVKVGNQELSRSVYSNDRKGLLDEMNFGNGAKVRYEYDDFGRTTAIYVDEPGETSATPKYEFKYDARGIASVIKDNVLMTETRVTSDLADRPSESITKDANGNLLHKNVLNYDGKNCVKEFLDILPEATHKAAYTYDADNRVSEVKFDDSDTHKVNYSYDLLNRIATKTVTNGVPYSTNYTYVAGDTAAYGANATTPLISTITQGSGANAMNFAYTYDSRGNIISETRNGVTTTYEYDELGQLIRVNDPNDPAADSVRGTTWVYSYDRGGNILQKLAYVLSSDAQPSELRQSLIYEYTDANWKDKLTLFCNDELEYDAIGNLTDDGQWTYTWEKGRQLKSMHNANTGVTMEFKYNHQGIRTQKVKKVNGTVTETTDYTLKGKQIAAMKKNTDTYYFTYDTSGAPVTVNFNGAVYTYVKNLQGDIVGILDTSGNLVVEYKYDAWGDAVSIYSASTTVDNLAFDNPFRYRGYIWDEETELHYVSSRYYNAHISRFINSDDIDYLGAEDSSLSYNLFVYCLNNPVNRFDVNGNWSLPNWAKKVVAAVAVVAVVTVVAVATVATAGAGTAAAVIAVGAAKGAAIGMVSGAAIGAITGAVEHRLSTGSWSGAGTAALNGMGDGALSGSVTGAITGGLSRGIQVLRNTRMTNVRSLPPKGKPLSSNSLIKNGNVNQTRYYNWKGRPSWDIDFTNHGTPNVHSLPHAHKWGATGRSGPLNTTSGIGWW